MTRARGAGPVGFLFLGETLLIPHLWPIVEALATAAADLPIEIWISTSVHEALLGRWAAPYPNVRLRRVPGFRTLAGYADGRNPPLPPKLPMLARLLPYILRTPLVVVAERTSLWLPALLPLRTRFLQTTHGVAPMSARGGRRGTAAWRLLVPSARERATYLARDLPPDYVCVTGYVKAAFRHQTNSALGFPQARPIILYTPHWQRHRSSWWNWGRDVVAMLCAQDRYNVILAPHQRLVEKEPDLRGILTAAAAHPHVHADIDSFAMVDGSYTKAADIYLGDTSSQVTEYLMRPRPCVFLNSHAIDWETREDHAFWRCGEVVDTLDDLMAVLGRAPAAHPRFAADQVAYARDWLGDTSGDAPMRVVEHILAGLDA